MTVRVEFQGTFVVPYRLYLLCLPFGAGRYPRNVGKTGNGQKVRPKSEVSTSREQIREVAYQIEKITKRIGVSTVGLD
jgi:hypothetical protein